MAISAVVLSANPVTISYPGLVTVDYVSTIRSASDLFHARSRAMRKVRTEHFFFLDDDDALPDDYQRVLDLCLAQDQPLVYTGELVVSHKGETHYSPARPYSPQAHLDNPLLVHHLALCRTQDALEVLDTLPHGCYGFEQSLFFQLAKRGVAAVDEAGYIWQRPRLMHKEPTVALGIVRSLIRNARGL